MTIQLFSIPVTGAAPQSGAILTAYMQKAQSLGFAAIGTSYASAPSVIGSSGSVSFASVAFTNTTNEDLFVCIAGIGATPSDQFYVLAGTTRQIDFMTNRRIAPIDFVYVRSAGSAPTSGNFIFEGYL